MTRHCLQPLAMERNVVPMPSNPSADGGRCMYSSQPLALFIAPSIVYCIKKLPQAHEYSRAKITYSRRVFPNMMYTHRFVCFQVLLTLGSQRTPRCLAGFYDSSWWSEIHPRLRTCPLFPYRDDSCHGFCGTQSGIWDSSGSTVIGEGETEGGPELHSNDSYFVFRRFGGTMDRVQGVNDFNALLRRMRKPGLPSM